ncbi:MAG: Cytochrome c551 peroxidase (EC [uncultured Thiotrichaceae bacterium]|uniref:Cytochrome c551 peroxidase (EC) n=1 Tax=uncultured Thiotrichaceae bacterium TaxID=298394 RepID=A0A6S6SGM9_9GAMM|nr:MAG: Cytochrome c551 peroxidase (EC [uncultured Thiotrichaceae bacterium]
MPGQAKPLTATPHHPANSAWESLESDTQKAVNQVFVNTAKVIAAFEETIVSRNSPFDRFAAGMKTGDEDKQQAISVGAKKGLKLFVGKAGCVQCHFGPNFSDGEFHHLFLEKRQPGLPDGRYLGIAQLMVDPFNTKSAYNDAPADGSYRSPLDYVYRNVEFRGQFKTPSLRNAVKTAPYMHTGELSSLEEVVGYYNQISERQASGNHQETVLKSLNLTPDEQGYLVAFLQTLTDESFLETLSQRAK